MAKGYLISDIHLGVHRLDEDKWLEIAEKYFYYFFIPTIKKTYNKEDKIFILGDLFDNRTYLSLKVISFALDLFIEFEKNNLDIIIIGGNHDYYNNNDSENTSLRILERYNNVEIFTEPTIYNFSNRKILLMPWNGIIKEEQKIFREFAGKVDYMFSHSELKGAKTNLKVDLKSGMNISDFVAFKKIYSGHIHLHQNIENFTYLGSPFHIDRNDKGNKKGITVIDFNTEIETFIENNFSPEYKTIEITTEEDIQLLDTLIENDENNNNFIDILISNSIIMNNIEARKKIEKITKNEKATTIKQIDDISIKNTIKDIKLEDIGSDFNVEEMLMNTIECQNIEENNKSEMLKLLQESIKICKEL